MCQKGREKTAILEAMIFSCSMNIGLFGVVDERSFRWSITCHTIYIFFHLKHNFYSNEMAMAKTLIPSLEKSGALEKSATKQDSEA